MKKFELGKKYEHSGGGIMKIVGMALTDTYGICLIAEEPDGTMKPVGTHEDNFINWHEIK